MSGDPVNWLFLAELIVVVIVVSAFLFYWNRIFGSCLAFIIRLIAWRKYNAYLVIGSFQISPLAGRIAFRDVEYHSSNLSCRVLHGNITFRYWKLRVQHEGDSQSSNPKRARLPCRIAAKLDGLEVFCFNRTPAYDAIVERMKKHEAAEAEREKADNDLSPTESASTSAQPARTSARQRRTNPLSRESSLPTESNSPASETPKPAESRFEHQHRTEAETLSWLFEALPLEIKIDRGSVVLGSDATPMVLIIDCKRANGIVEISEPRSHCDLYRMSINMALSDVNVLMRKNTDYSGPLLAHGKRIYDDLVERDSRIQLEPPSVISSFPGFHWLAKRFDFLYDPRLSVPPVAGLPADRVWKGLARYRLPDEKVGCVPLQAENQYAKVATILSTRALDLTYYSDTPGVVPDVMDRLDVDLNDMIGNIELPPEWGVDITLHGGNVNYGPWTDRQRDALQKAFTPSIFFDTEPRVRLKAGDTRLHANLAVNVNMTEKTTLRIPTREPSKDWQWDNANPETQRRYGWLDVEVGPNSSVGYTQSQIATPQGYDSMLMLHLDSLSIASSVNMQTFVVAKTCKLSMTMPNPLVWNAQRNWGIDIALDTPEIWLLREHIALIADLSKDWSSGTVGDFRHFVPMHYSFRFSLIKHIIHLYINDFNIVDVPRSKDHNAFLDIKGPRLDAYVAVASTRYRPEFSVVPFTVEAKNAIVELSLPSWDTHHSFGTPSLEVGRIGDIRVSGSYRYYARPQPDHVEKLKLHLEAEGVAFLALGWVVRRIFCVKDNYFGEFTQFSTMQEFLEKFDHSPEAVGDPIEEKYRPGKSDPFAVHLTVDVRDSLILMSDEIYAADKGIAIPVPQLQLDLKNNEFQMDMSLDFAPTYVVACNNIAQSYSELSAPLQRDQDVVFVEGIEIKANRLFGPQPQATTYVCLWEISLSRISAFLSPVFKETLASVGTAVGYNWTDHDNAPASVYIAETPPDATFVKVSVAHVTALLSSGNSGVAVELPKGLFIDTSSMASKLCRSVMGLGVPGVAVHVLHRRKQTKRWEPVGSISTGLSLDTYKMPKGWEEEAAEQQKFLQKEDEPTRRVPYLYGAHDNRSAGRHYFDVYVPRPQLVDMPTLDASREAIEEEDESSDSELNSDDTRHTVSRSRISRRKRAQTVSREERFSSLDDQGSTSSESHETITPIDEIPPEEVITTARPSKSEDMATVLEDRLKTIAKIQLRAARLFNYPSESTPASCGADAKGEPFVPLTIAYGSIMRINLDKTVVELNPDTLRAVANVSGGMSTAEVRREVLLDKLLDDHVTAVLKGAKKMGSTLYNVTVPQVDLRLVLGSFQHPESIVHCTLDAPAIRFLETPVPDSTVTSTSATAEVRAFCVTLLKQDTSHNTVSLIDVPNFETAPRGDGILPFVRVAATRLTATFNDEPGKETVQFKALDCTLQAATPGVPTVSYLIDTWRPIVETLPSHFARFTVADVIYDVLSDTVEEGLAMALPNFMYESSYALQFNDQRSLRHDIGWFTIARLRHWMRMGPRHEPSAQRPPEEQMSKSVMEWLLRLDEPTVNEQVLFAQPYLRKAFGKYLDRAGLTPESRMDTSVNFFFGIDALLVRHYGRLLETGAIAASAITIENVTVGSERHKMWEGDLPLTTVQALITVGRLAVDLHNSIISVYDAVLEHVDTHREAIHELPIVHAVDQGSRVVVDVHLGDLSAAISAGGMRLDVIFTGAQASTTIERSRRTEDIAEARCIERNAFLLNCQSVRARLREAVDTVADDADKDKDRDLVFSEIRGVGCTADSKMDNFDPKAGSARLAFNVDAFEFDSRPQLKAFFDFGQDWRRNHYPLYVPTLEHTKAVSERRKAFREASPHKRPTQPHRGTILRSVALDVVVRSARLQARAAKGLWLGWDMGQVYAYRNGSPDHLQFGLQVAPQVVGAYPSVKRIKTKDSSVIHLPSITITATLRDQKRHPSLNANVKLGMFTGILKPAVLDRLLSLHQRLGNDVLAVIGEVRGSKESTPHLEVPPTLPARPAKSPLVFRIQASVDGVRVGLRADNVPPTLMFEALRLQGSASNIEASKLQWTAKANHVGLSIIRMADGPSYQAAEPLRGTRSVSMVLDISAEETPGTQRTPSKLNITLSRVHTVMHVAALSELGDLIRSWSSDIAVLRKVHHDEVAEVKEQTTRVLKKLDAAHKEKEKERARDRVSPSASVSGMSDSNATIETWFASRVLTLEVTGIGIAIPLDEAAAIEVAKRAGGDAGPALLYSVRFIGLTTSRTETARFRVQNTLLQFVEQFDSGHLDSFQGPYHRSTNFMELPSIESEAQMDSSPGSLKVTANCTASDFKLSLTPDIADGISRLTDLYEHGKEHLSAMERDYRTEWAKFEEPGQPADTLAEKYDLPADHAAQTPHKVHVQVSCRFDSGVVELHRTNAAAHAAKERRQSTHQKAGRWAKEQNLDKFTLPTVSVYAEYSGTENTEDHQRTLLFNLAVHESHNVLHPTILPFFVDVVTRVERRAESRTDPVELPKPSPESAMPITERALERIADAPTGKLRLQVTLRIDRSELRLSCAPDSSAFVDLKWESGGFVASTLLGGKDTTTLAGSVSGVTAYLSHEFAEQGQGCIEAGAKDLVFNLTLCDADSDSQQRGLSVIVDTQVAVKFRLDAFSAWLIFMAVWVDAAPKFEIKKPAEAPNIPVNPVASTKLSVAVLVRFRSIDFDANVSVTQARLEMTPIVIKTVSDGERSTLKLSIGTTLVTAEGDIFGNLRSESLQFSTVRRSTRATIQSNDSQLLQMKIEGGDLSGNLFIADTNIVRFQLEPSVVTLVDDWKELATNPSGQVHLDFIANAGKFSGVLRLPAIPRLLGNFYSIFDMVDVQKRIASQRSEAFKRHQKHSSDQTPTTTVVLPMKPQADATDTGGHVRTAQRMRFELAGLDVGIISDDFDDSNVVAFYRFFIGTVRAELFRQGSEAGLPLRELLLYIDFLQWQSADGNRVTRFERHDMSARELIDRAVAKGWNNVAILPKMNLKMDSTELLDPKTVEYDFDVAWGDTDADIKIMPNFLKAAFNSFRKLVRGVDQQQLDRAKRRGDVRMKTAAKRREEAAAGQAEDVIQRLGYRRRGEGPFNNPVPKLRAMGDVTGDAAMMVPQIKQALGELPAYSHRFVTLPLEEGMDLLLKLYEHQLPAVAEDET